MISEKRLAKAQRAFSSFVRCSSISRGNSTASFEERNGKALKKTITALFPVGICVRSYSFSSYTFNLYLNRVRYELKVIVRQDDVFFLELYSQLKGKSGWEIVNKILCDFDDLLAGLVELVLNLSASMELSCLQANIATKQRLEVLTSEGIHGADVAVCGNYVSYIENDSEGGPVYGLRFEPENYTDEQFRQFALQDYSLETLMELEKFPKGVYKYGDMNFLKLVSPTPSLWSKVASWLSHVTTRDCWATLARNLRSFLVFES